MPAAPHPKLHRLVPFLVAAVAFGVFARTLDGGLLSDDLLLSVLGTPRDDGGFAVDWSAVFADFGRPWLGFDAPFYRPLLTVSFATDLDLGGGAAWPFHLTNVLAHTLVVGVSAALAAMLCPRRPAIAATIAGLCVALHPVAVEPVAWIAARNSELEVTFRMVAMLAFAAWLRDGRRNQRIVSVVFAACAFATKESAVMLPVSLLAIDLLMEPRRPWRERVRLHLPIAVLVVAYFALRLLLFGALVGDGGGHLHGTAVERFVTKLGALLHADTFATAPLLGFVLAAGLFRARLTLVIGAVWIALHMIPTWQLSMTEGLGGSRMVYGALPVLGVMTARILSDGAPMPRAAALLAAATWLLLLFPTSHKLDTYDAAWQDMEDAKAGILAIADRASPERPLALAAMPPLPPGIPPFNPNAWFAIASRPNLERDVPVVSLGFLTIPVPLAESLLEDASAARAVLERGCAIATWDTGRRAFRVRERAVPAPLPPLVATDDRPGELRFERPVPADAFGALTVHVVDGAPDGVRVGWLCAVADELPEALAGIDAAGGVADGGGTTFEIDVSHHMGPLSLATFGIRMDGLRIDVAGTGRVAAVTAHARVPELPVDTWLDREPAPLRALERITAPQVDGDAALRLVILGPHSAIPVACTPGEAVAIPAAVRREFAGFARIARQPNLLFWFEALTPPGRPGFARSRVDRLVFRPATD